MKTTERIEPLPPRYWEHYYAYERLFMDGAGRDMRNHPDFGKGVHRYPNRWPQEREAPAPIPLIRERAG